MSARFLHTSDLARAAGVHPNTVRLYERWGLLPAVPRGPNGYRLFTAAHREQMILARLALHGGWPGRRLRRSAMALVKCAAAGRMEEARALAREHLELVRAERARAEAAAAHLLHWGDGNGTGQDEGPLGIKDAAALLALTPDILRNWEKNGLLAVPRDPRNGYRLYGPAEIGRLRVIGLLFRAGFGAAAVLRALNHLDAGRGGDPRRVLDTPPPEEDIHYTTDRWLSTMAEQEERAVALIAQVEKMLALTPTSTPPPPRSG